MKRFAMYSVALVLLASGLGTTQASPVRKLTRDQACTENSGNNVRGSQFQHFVPSRPLLGGVQIETRMEPGGVLHSVKVTKTEGEELIYEWHPGNRSGVVRLDVPLGEVVRLNPGEVYRIDVDANLAYKWFYCSDKYPGGTSSTPDFDFVFEVFTLPTPV